MATAKARKGLGRGLSALIPDDDMEFLSRVARGETLLTSNEQPSDMTSTVNTVVEHQSEVGAPAWPPSSTTAPQQPVIVANNPASDPEASAATSTPVNTVKAGQSEGQSPAGAQWVEVGSIEANPYQPRRTFSEEEMQELAASVREHGILQPVLVRPLSGEGLPSDAPRFQLVAGERRWRAAQLAGLKRVPAIVRQVNDQQALELALIENVQRHDISALDAAIAYKRLGTEFGLTQEEIARRVGKSRPAVANTMRLLDLPAEVRADIENGNLSEGHGKALLQVPTDGGRRALYRRIVRDKLSVREVEHLARRELDARAGSTQNGEPSEQASSQIRNGAAAGSKGDAQNSVRYDVREVEATLQKALGLRARLRPRAKGGQIIIDYPSNEELSRLLQIIAETGGKA